MSRIDIHIDTLVLRGIDRADAAAVAAAISQTLQAALAPAGAGLVARASAHRLDAGNVSVAPNDGAGLGAAVAHNIARRILP